MPSPYSACAPCTGIVERSPWPAPGQQSEPQYGRLMQGLRSMVRPDRGIQQAISNEMTTIAVVAGMLVAVAAVLAVPLDYATVGGATRSLSDDASAGIAMLVVACATLATVFTARWSSGLGVGLLAGAASGVPFVHLRAMAAVLGDGSRPVTWGPGFAVLSFAAVVALVPTCCALSGVRSGRMMAKVPWWFAPVGLAGVLIVSWWRWSSVIDTAGDLGAAARVALSSVLAGELVMLTLAVGMRSRVGAGVFLGAAVLPAATILADAGASAVSIDLSASSQQTSILLVLLALGVSMFVLARRPGATSRALRRATLDPSFRSAA